MKSTRQLFTKLFWMDAFERIIATFGEVMLGFLTVDATPVKVDWSLALYVAGIASLAALAKAVVAAAKADTDTASLTVDTKEFK